MCDYFKNAAEKIESVVIFIFLYYKSISHCKNSESTPSSIGSFIFVAMFYAHVD